MNDIALALRSLARTPGAVLAIVVILGLGIGVNTSVFSLYKAVLLDSLFFGESDNVLLLQQHLDADHMTAPFSATEIADLRAVSTTLEFVEEEHNMSFTLLGLDQPWRVQTDVVSAGYFDLLGIEPLLGRTFRPDEDEPDSAPTILLSHRFWQEKTGGDPHIVGRSLVMNAKSHEVIGVLPPEMDVANTDAWVTTPHCPTRSSESFRTNREMRMMAVFARKRPDVTMQQVRAELATIARRFVATHPESYPDDGSYGIQADRLQDVISAPFQQTGLLLMLVSTLILIAALANVSNLTLARVGRREGELAVRSALGASRSRLARLLFTEHVLLGVLGGTVGIAFAALTTGLLAEFATRFNPLAALAGVDLEVLGYALLLSLVVGVVAGMLPVLGLGSTRNALQSHAPRSATSSRTTLRSRNTLTAVQIALTLVVLSASLMMLRSLDALNKVRPGFAIDQIVTARINLNPARYPGADEAIGFADRLIARLQQQPGITHVGLASAMPMESEERFHDTRITLPDEPNRGADTLPLIDFRTADEGYFATMDIRLVDGRGIERRDDLQSSPVAVANRALAEALWPHGSAIGKRVTPQNSIFAGDEGSPSFEIVGVVDNVRQYGPREKDRPALYVPVRQAGYFGRVALRGTAGAASLKQSIGQAVRELDPEQPVDRVLSTAEIRDVTIEATALLTLLLNIFAALVLAISVVGLGGLVAFNVGERLREFSIRLAVGAGLADLYRLVLRYALVLLAAGVAGGLAGALVIGRGLRGYLYNVEPSDPFSIAAAVALLSLTGLAAVLIPARRLKKLQPAEVLTEQ
jgi:putative ABC transport system permease protein